MAAPRDPYEPPGSEIAVPAEGEKRWSSVAAWIGALEMVLGLTLGIAGCATALGNDESMASVGAMVIFLGAMVILWLPGFVLLVTKHRLRWAGQLVPAAIALWTLVSLVR